MPFVWFVIEMQVLWDSGYISYSKSGKLEAANPCNGDSDSQG